VYTCLIDLAHAPDVMSSPVFPRLQTMFHRLILVSSLHGVMMSSLQVHDFEGMMGVELNKNLLNPFEVFIKRSMDIVLSLLALSVMLPVGALACLLIWLESPGPVFYTQLRVGKNRRDVTEKDRVSSRHVRRINIYKFRTMVVDAERRLEEYLKENPQARAEWDLHQKLRHDPRITRVGAFLRKFSLDELPQLINVLKGEMSLVGPRPIMLDQVPLYGDILNIYHSVRPGLTGLWQVSGRNRTSFEERAAFDEYYVHNWSIWLDIYILLRTVWVVLSRDGAY
jgi:Undecaprenyl-phosphate galactose phosphotransferase WbaP